MATDAFPPVCGGSGWSTYELARGLRERGHDIFVVQPKTVVARVLSDPPTREYDGFHVVEFHAWAPGVPFLRNYFKNERLYASFATFLREFISTHGIDVVHAQHVLTGPPGIAAARAAGVPSVCTVRDYWPICYWSDLIDDYASDRVCPECTPGMMTRCIRPRGGAAWPLALPVIPYMRSNLRMKQARLSDASAVIAVSSAVADLLRERAPALARTRLDVIPNPVDVDAVSAEAAETLRAFDGPYALFVGKLEANKGVATLLPVMEEAALDWPLVIVGDGAERPALEAAAQRSGRRVHFTGWRPRAEVLAWMRDAAFVVFPSRWPEPLSRVLLEASALGVPIAALDTGGTRDVVVDDHTGLIAQSIAQLATAVRRLRQDDALRARLGPAAREHVRARFATPIVAARVESLYRDLTL